MSKMSFEQRFTVSLAASQYVRARLHMDKSARSFDTAANELREAAPQETKFVVEVDFQSWLIERKPDGELSAEQIEQL